MRGERRGRSIGLGRGGPRRFVAVVLLLTLPPQLGCTAYSPIGIKPAQLTPAERSQPGEPRLVGVVTAWGREYMFDSAPQPRIHGDTLYASAAGAPYRLPRPSIRRLVMIGARGEAIAVRASTLEDAADAALGPRIREIRTTTGRDVRFDRTRAVYVGADSVHGVAGGDPVAIPLADVDQVTVTRRDPSVFIVTATAGFVGSIVLLFEVMKHGSYGAVMGRL